MDHKLGLEAGYELSHYRIERVLGHGGFGITYLAHDQALKTDVAIKEYFPADLATRLSDDTVSAKSQTDVEFFEKGLEYFVQEARTVASYNHPNIIAVKHFFQENGTGYMVMPYEKGQSLAEILTRHVTIDEAEIGEIIEPLLDALETVHAAGYLHRDIKPGNIYIRHDGTPILIDFGAARVAVGQKSKSLTSFVTEGYAPLELYYTGEDQGPWTDIYQLGATFYRAAFGDKPPEAPSRVRNDRIEWARDLGHGKFSERFLTAVDAALAVDPDDRPQDVATWRGMFVLSRSAAAAAVQPPAPVPAAAPPDPFETLVRGRPVKEQPATPANQDAPRERAVGRPRGGGRRIAVLSSVAAAVLLLAGGGAWVAMERGLFDPGPAPVHACDRLAANYWDPTKLVPGVRRLDQSSAGPAVEACRAALADFPDEPRFQAQLGRALVAVGNPTEAAEIVAPAAEQFGHPAGQRILGRLLLQGNGVSADPDRGWQYLSSAAGAGHVSAQYEAGIFMKRGEHVAKDEPGAYRWLLQAANAGHSAAQYEVGHSLRNGVGITRNDEEAARFYRMAAEQRHTRAQVELSFLYYRGIGVERDLEQSARWSRAAAEAGHRIGQYNYGVLLYNGDGVERDDSGAREWFERSAAQNYPDAYLMLGQMHEEGRAFEESASQAYFRYLVAKRLGSEDADQRLERLRGRLSLAQRLVAERRANDWRP